MRRIGKWLGCAALLAAAACGPVAVTTAPRSLVVEEHRLSGPPDISTDQLVFHFADGDQERLLARTAPYRDARAQVTAYNNRILSSFGYRMENYQRSPYGIPLWSTRIFRDQEVIADAADWVKPASVNASGTDFIAEVEMGAGSYALSRGHFDRRPFPPGIEPEAYVGDRLLSVEIKDGGNGEGGVNIYLDQSLVYQAKTGYAIPFGSTDGPWSYDGHWAIVLLVADQNLPSGQTVTDHVVLDGTDLNSKYGYDQSYQFALLAGRPFYFHQKSGAIHLSYDGRDLSNRYDEIPHYGCCSSALLNPGVSMNSVWFFARRGGDWYYVEAYAPAADAP
jgi:hypothetical protein